MPRIRPRNTTVPRIARFTSVDIKCVCGKVLIKGAVIDRKLLPFLKSVIWDCGKCLGVIEMEE